jgi:hypothetical protein
MSLYVLDCSAAAARLEDLPLRSFIFVRWNSTKVQVLSIVIALVGISNLPPCITTTSHRQNMKKDLCIVLLLQKISVLK